MEKPKTTKPANTRRPTPPLVRWAQAALALALSYVVINWAIDSGSLLEYAVGIVFFGLGIMHVRQAFRAQKERRG